jgi:hypothetical protein
MKGEGIAQGEKGVVVGCPKCRKKFGTVPQSLDHTTDDVLPKIIDSLSATCNASVVAPFAAIAS